MKQKHLIASLALSGWYAVLLAVAQWSTLERTLTGAARLLYVVVFQMAMPLEAQGAMLYWIIPIILCAMALIICFFAKEESKLFRFLYIAPPILLGIPPITNIVFICVQWTPFRMGLCFSLIYNFIISIIWFWICFILLFIQKCKRKMHNF